MFTVMYTLMSMQEGMRGGEGREGRGGEGTKGKGTPIFLLYIYIVSLPLTFISTRQVGWAILTAQSEEVLMSTRQSKSTRRGRETEEMRREREREGKGRERGEGEGVRSRAIDGAQFKTTLCRL